MDAFLAVVTGCWGTELRVQVSSCLLFLLRNLPLFLPLRKPAHSEWRGERVGEKEADTGVLILLKPYNHQETRCNYPEHCGSWDACKCLSAVLNAVLD